MKRFVVIGNTVNRKVNFVTGQAMMLDLFVTIISKRFKCSVSSLSPIFSNLTIGSASFSRYLEYVWLMIRSLIVIIIHPCSFLYLCPAASKQGLLRDYIFVKVARLLGYKVVLQQFNARFSYFYEGLNSSFKKRLEYLYDSSILIITEGDFEKRQMRFVKDQSKIFVVPNGLPEGRETVTNLPKSMSDKCVHLLFLSNMIETKGYWDVLEAVNILVNKRKINVKCDFVGRFLNAVDDKRYSDCTEAEKRFYKYIKDNNLENIISYQNCAYGKDKETLFEQSHIFLLPSYFIMEGSPTVILEALSYGCVCIVTKYRLIPEMVNEKNGIYVNSRKPMEIADAIEMLFKQPEKYKRMSMQALEDFNQKFTRNRYEERINECLDWTITKS